MKKNTPEETYRHCKPIAVQSLCQGACMSILSVIHGIEDKVIVKGYTGDLHKYKLTYNNAGRAYFRYANGCRYYLDEFVKVS